MKNEQFLSFENIITFAKQHNNTNFSSFEDYQYLTGNDIIDFINSYFDDSKLEFDLNSEQLQEHLYEWADRNTPIYYSELAQWFSKNWTAIDEYIECFGYSPKMEIMQIIQATYCWTLEQSMQTALQNIKEKAVQ